MNEIQKANAKVAIEYWQKVLAGEEPKLEYTNSSEAWRASAAMTPEDLVVYRIKPREMVEQKGGSYPKPVDDLALVYGKEYYAPDPSAEPMFSVIAAVDDPSQLFQRCGRRKLLHETKEAAIQHAKVMLGVSDEA